MGAAGTPPGSLFVSLLGGFHVAGPSEGDTLSLERKKTRALLAVVALHAGRPVPRGSLTAMLWGEQSEEVARHALRQCLLDLRRALARSTIDVVRADGDVIGLDPIKLVVDVAHFERHAAQATPESLAQAVALYRGDLLEGFSLDEPAFEEWLRVGRERLKSRAVDALRKLLAARMRTGAADEAAPIAARLLVFEPFDEAVHRTLMRLYAESGRRGAAMRQYEECVELLARELGVEPEPETRALYRRLVSERVGSATPGPAARHRGAVPRVSFQAPAGASLVGRASDLEWLEGLREGAHRGQPRVALVIGEAGIGKSRLVGELASRAQYRRAEILLGRGREGEDVLAFAPWVEALRPALSDDLVRRLALVARRDLARLLPEIAAGRAEPLGGIEDGPRIFEAVAHLLREAAARHPLVVVIEDLHWCDEMTVRLLRFLPRRLLGQPVLLVATARPEEMLDGSVKRGLIEALERDPVCASRILSPLSRGETTQLFRGHLSSTGDEPSPALAERVWTLSAGNPFVVLECVRVAREQGVAGASLELPDQVRALTIRHLASVSDGAARLAECAAVIGRDFDVAVLRRAAGVSEADVADGVEELVRRRVLREVEGRLDFGHDRVREVVYGRLLGPRRILLHRLVAEALEAVHADDLDPYCAAIGTHYRHSGVWQQACTYQARAGAQAWARGAGREALACFEEVLRSLTRLPATEARVELGVRMRLAANGALVATGRFEQGRSHLLEAERLVDALSDPRWGGRVAAALGYSYRAGGVLDRALAFGQRALDVAGQTGDRRLESVARLVLGQRENFAGDFGRSLEHLASVLDLDSPSPETAEFFLLHLDHQPELRAAARHWMVRGHVELGDFDAALRLIEQARQASDALVDPLGTQRLFAHLGLGYVHGESGDVEAAVRAYEEALALYREDCHVHLYNPLAWGLGLAYTQAGRAREGFELFEKSEVKALRPMRLVLLGRALVHARRTDEAARVALETLEQARRQGARALEASALWLLAEVARLRMPADRAEMKRCLHEAVAGAEALGMRPLAARCHLRLAWYYRGAEGPEFTAHRDAAKRLLAEMGGFLKRDALDEEVLA